MARLKDCRVLIADDHPIVNTGLANLLRPHCRLISTADSLPEVWRLLHGSPPDVVLLDVSFGTSSSLHELPNMRAQFPAVVFVILTAHGPVLEAAAMRSGAHAFVSKTVAAQEVIATLCRAVEEGAVTIPPPESPPLVPIPTTGEPGSFSATPRQAEVLTILLKGHTQSEVAEQMGISRRTVEYHLDELRRRTGIRRMSLLLAWFRAQQESAPKTTPPAQ